MWRWWSVVVVTTMTTTGCGPSEQVVDPCASRTAGELVITELMLDPDGADTGAEWVELYNPGSTPRPLAGLSLYTKDLDGTNARTTVLPELLVPPGAWYVLGDVREGPPPPWVNASYGEALGALGNARGVLGLRCGTVVLDEVSWTRGTRPGHSLMLSGQVAPDAVVNDLEANWCDAPDDAIYFGIDTGTPGLANPACPVALGAPSCFENGVVRPVVLAQPGDLVLTEVMTRPHAASTANGQWFEVLALAQVDLNGLTLANGSGASTTVSSAACLRVDSGGYALFARNGDSFVNGGLPQPMVVYSLPLSTGNERLALSVGDAGIDALAVTSATLGHAWQLDPDRLDQASNDDPASFCRANERWAPDGGDFGSPGAPNPPCSPVPDGGPLLLAPNRCLDRASGTLRALRTPPAGALVITEWLANPSAVPDATGEWVELFGRAGFDLNGLTLVDASGARSTLTSAWCLGVEQGTWAVVARDTNRAANGNVPAVATFGFTLNNGAESISVLGADGGVLDQVSFAGSRAGVSTQRAPDGGATCPSTSRVWLVDGGPGDLGTPGAANDCP